MSDILNQIGGSVNTINLNNIDHPIEDENAQLSVEQLRAMVDSLEQQLNLVKSLIPSQATAQNQLADKDFVNSSVSTNTAYLVTNNGQPFDSVEQLEAYTGEVTNNDYAYVKGTDELGNPYYDRYKYNSSTQQWSYEFRMNNSTFTANQWKAINSGITSEDVENMAVIDDTTASSNKVYSSQKTQNELNTKASTSQLNNYLLKSGGTITNSIKGTKSEQGGSWVSARDNALVKLEESSGSLGYTYRPLINIKTSIGDWSIGALSGESTLAFSFVTDSDYIAGNNKNKKVALGTYALCPTSFITDKPTKYSYYKFHHNVGTELNTFTLSDINVPIVPLKWEGMIYMPNQNFAFQLEGAWANANLGDWQALSYLSIPASITSSNKNVINIRYGSSLKGQDFDIYVALWYTER